MSERFNLLLTRISLEFFYNDKIMSFKLRYNCKDTRVYEATLPTCLPATVISPASLTLSASAKGIIALSSTGAKRKVKSSGSRRADIQSDTGVAIEAEKWKGNVGWREWDPGGGQC